MGQGSAGRHALLIGVNEYDFLGELSYAQRDADIFARALVDHCDFDPSEVQVMSCAARGGLRAQGRYIEEMIAGLTDLAPLDLLVFGFWGHGFTSDDGALYLCGFDAREDSLERTAVSLALVKAKLAQVRARDTLFVLDCCQARAAGRGAANTLHRSAATELENVARLVQAPAAEAAQDAAPGAGAARSVAMLSSCKEGESAYEWHERQHGVFTAHLIDGIEDGLASASALAGYLSDHVPRTAQTLHRQMQTPWYLSEGRGDICLSARQEEPAPETQSKREAAATEAADTSQLMRLSADLRDILFMHRRSNPCRIDTLLEKYNAKNPNNITDRDALLVLMNQARSAGLLSGFHFNSDLAFLSVELLSAKLDLNRPVKELIGRHAALRVYSGMTIGIDSGSTTLAFARELIRMLEANALDDLAVVTNSIGIATEFTKALVQLEQGDKKGLCQVTLIGGWCRPTSLATVPRSEEQLRRLVECKMIPERVDLSFVAANGFFQKRGFANSHRYEVPCKRYLSTSAAESIYLMEARKLEIEQPCIIEEFRDGIELLTNLEQTGSDHAQDVLESMARGGAKVTVCDA